MLHVLIVSNHWELKKRFPSAGIFIDRQVVSLRNAGLKISTFDVGAGHSPFHLFKKWIELRRTVRRMSPDIVHAQYGTLVGFIAVMAGRPTVISFCGADLIASATVPLFRRYFGFLLSNVAAAFARALICKSQELKEALWWRRQRAVVIPNGVDLDVFSPGPQQAAREQLGWDIDHPVVLFYDNDPKIKGLDVAEAAMHVVRSLVPNAELHIISGVDPTRMPLYYRAADVLLCASIAEGSPNMVKEALACNLPVVSSPVGDVPERLAGVYPSEVVPREPKALGEAVAKVLHIRQRSNGRECIAHLDLQAVAGRVVQVYRSVLSCH